MKITRRKLDLKAAMYSREWDVDRSTGIHLMPIVEYIAQTSGIEKRHTGKVDLEAFATPGFLWEHVVTREERLETALSYEAMRMEFIHRPELLFPGEMFWCRQCDDVMTGGKFAQEHALSRRHKGIYCTPDALNFKRDRYAEMKVTWKSSRRSHPEVLDSPKGVWRWTIQDMWNCYVLGVTKAEMKVLHVCGERGFGLHQPQAFELDLDFTEREIRRTVAMIVTNARNKGWI